MSIECSRFQMRRVSFRLPLLIGGDTGPARHQRANFDARRHAQTAGSLRSEQTFVPGEAENVYSHFLHVDRIRPRGLRGVHDQDRAALMCGLRHSSNVHKFPGQVGCMCAHDQINLLSA